LHKSIIDSFNSSLDKNLIKVYPFYGAPQRYQELSQHGGDEDWVIVGSLDNLDIGHVAQILTVFEKHVYDIEEDGQSIRVYITAHA